MPTHFERQLEELHKHLITLGNLCEKAITLSAESIQMQEQKTAKMVFETDHEIEKKERELESLCMHLLLHQQPVAGDLREISAALGMISDMERIGDQAADIADLSLFIDKTKVRIPDTISEMAQVTVDMVTESVEAFVKSDLELCRKVIRDDDLVDTAFNQVKEMLADLIYKQNLDAKAGLDHMILSSSLLLPETGWYRIRCQVTT